MTSVLLKGSLGGIAVVCCVHDREKRQIRSIESMVQLGREMGIEYDSKKHKIHECACCENMFVDPTDTPRLCWACQHPSVHAQTGPVPNPTGVVQ